MKKRCLICDVAAYAAIAAGLVLLAVVLPGWIYLVVLAAALILGGLIWLKTK